MQTTNAKTVSVEVAARFDLAKLGKARVQAVHLSKRERLVPALKILSKLWLSAIPCIFIPMLHFVLVPGCLIFGILLFRQKYAFQELLIEGEFNCPSCQKLISANKTAFNWPIVQQCSHCETELLIRPVTVP